MPCVIGEGDEGRLRELCEELLGPMRRSSDQIGERSESAAHPRLLGLDIRKLLSHDVLREIARNRSHQRLVNEFQELLSEVA